MSECAEQLPAVSTTARRRKVANQLVQVLEIVILIRIGNVESIVYVPDKELSSVSKNPSDSGENCKWAPKVHERHGDIDEIEAIKIMIAQVSLELVSKIGRFAVKVLKFNLTFR